MLTIMHPEVLPFLRSIPVGLLVLTPPGAERPILVVKATKEVLLAARIRRAFWVYVAPVTVGSIETIALVTAFFDVPDEPLIVRSPLFQDDERTQRLIGLLLAEEADIHLFDEHTRELLAYHSSIRMQDETHGRLQRSTFAQFSDGAWRSVDGQMQSWFSRRTAKDDAEAIEVSLGNPLMPEDLAVLDASRGPHDYLGAPSATAAMLVRQEPGPMQEHDIALLLGRLFRSEQIIRNPLRIYDREEVSDILVVTDRNAIFVQAKDSPNTEKILSNALSRKRATTLKNLTKAIGQLHGAIRYARRQEPMPILIGKKECTVPLAGLRWYSLAIVKELFDDEYDTYSTLALQLAKETRIPCVALDYGELALYTAHLSNEESFIAALDMVFTTGLEQGILPRLRVGPAIENKDGE